MNTLTSSWAVCLPDLPSLFSIEHRPQFVPPFGHIQLPLSIWWRITRCLFSHTDIYHSVFYVLFVNLYGGDHLSTMCWYWIWVWCFYIGVWTRNCISIWANQFGLQQTGHPPDLGLLNSWYISILFQNNPGTFSYWEYVLWWLHQITISISISALIRGLKLKQGWGARGKSTIIQKVIMMRRQSFWACFDKIYPPLE